MMIMMYYNYKNYTTPAVITVVWLLAYKSL